MKPKREFTHSSFRLSIQHYQFLVLPVSDNSSIGIVQRNQWNRSTISMEWLNEINGIVSKNCQFFCVYLADFLQKNGRFISRC
jgi:hypothetical protein